MTFRNNLLRIDATAGLTVGVFMFALFPFLLTLYGMPTWMLATMGAANLAYGSYSFTLARSAVRTRARLTFLVIANAMWAVLCMIAAVIAAQQLTMLGIGTLVFEGAFVGTLAMLEWRAIPILLR